MNLTTRSKSGEVVLYQSPDGEVRLEVQLEQDTVWLTQAQIAELFGRKRSVITKHIKPDKKVGTSRKFARYLPFWA